MEIRNTFQHSSGLDAVSGRKQRMILTRLLKKVIPNSVIQRKLLKEAGNRVLLTFDDGPSQKTTPQVLDILDRYKLKALFFVVGLRIEKNPGVLQEIVDRGHMIGNHTYQHAMNPIIRPNEYQNDIIRCQELIKSEVGVTPTLYRPPGGRITISGLLAARRIGLESLFWSNDAGENSFNKGKSEAFITNLLISQLKPRDIILLHDDCPPTPHILEDLLAHINNSDIYSVDGFDHLGI